MNNRQKVAEALNELWEDPNFVNELVLGEMKYMETHVAMDVGSFSDLLIDVCITESETQKYVSKDTTLEEVALPKFCKWCGSKDLHHEWETVFGPKGRIAITTCKRCGKAV